MVVHIRKQEVWQCDRAQLQLLFGSVTVAWELRKTPRGSSRSSGWRLAGPTSPVRVDKYPLATTSCIETGVGVPMLVLGSNLLLEVCRNMSPLACTSLPPLPSASHQNVLPT